MKRLLGIGLGLVVALTLVGCSEKSERFPCENHGAIDQRTEVYSGTQPSGLYVCQDGHQEIWENGERTVG